MSNQYPMCSPVADDEAHDNNDEAHDNNKVFSMTICYALHLRPLWERSYSRLHGTIIEAHINSLV